MTTAFGHESPTWRQKFRSSWSALVDVVFPPMCANCGAVGELLCSVCRDKIAWVEEPVCARCGRFSGLGDESICRGCIQNPLPLRQIRTAVYYEGPIAATIKKFKYEGYFGLAKPLAALMVQAWGSWQMAVDMVVPIPLHTARQRERGYNQSEMLARIMESSLHWRVETAALKRVRRTLPQVGLNSAERQINVRGAFVTDPALIEGKKLLLIDDVRTTGATLVAAAEALLAAGAYSVSAYCLAGAGHGDDSIETVDA